MATVAIAGTDTGVGKTIVTAALAALAGDRGARVAVVKPAQTGVGPSDLGDLDDVRRLSGVEDLHEFVRLPEPLAPATAARRAGIQIPTVDDHATAIRALAERDLILVEGAGGLLVHLDAAGDVRRPRGASRRPRRRRGARWGGHAECVGTDL